MNDFDPKKGADGKNNAESKHRTVSEKNPSGYSHNSEYVPFASHSGSYHRKIKYFTLCEMISALSCLVIFLIRLWVWVEKKKAFTAGLWRGRVMFALEHTPRTALTVVAAAVLIWALIRAKRRRHNMRFTFLINGAFFLLSLVLIWVIFPA